MNNLKQLGLAVAGYESITGCLPPGSFPRRSIYGTTEDFSVFVRLLPFLEQHTTYSSANMSLTAYDPANGTVSATGIATLWCPSDYGVATSLPSWTALPIWGTSYSAVTGPWEWDYFWLVPGTLDQLMPGEAQRIAQLGLIYPLSSVRYAGVTDGLSNTLLFTETDCTTWYGTWTLGDGDDTLVGTTAPPNVDMQVLPGWFPLSAMSLHPGGVNCTFGDGSVKFLKSSIDSWLFNAAMDTSPCLGWNPPIQTALSVPCILKGARVGVWQALSTRSNGECIGADQY